MVSHAPNLTHFGSRNVFAGAILKVNEENLKKWLKDPEDLKPGNRMSSLAGAFNDPILQLTNSDIDALAAYLLSLK
jgi:cytochrome c oxidase subunit 2